MTKTTRHKPSQALKGPDHTALPDAFSHALEVGHGVENIEDFAGGRLKRRSISEQVANRIMAMIKSGNLKSGDQLPTEHQMTIAFGISRAPLREALKALTLMGVLDSRQGGRYTVTDLSPSRLIAPFNVIMSITEWDVQEHFEARAVVDVQLVRFCVERATVEHRQRILKLARDGRTFYNDPVAFRLHDIEFHQALNKGANNALLAALAQGLYDVALDVRRHASEMSGVIEVSVTQHCEVAEAVVNNEVETAATAYLRHLEHIRDTTIQSMQSTAKE